MRRPASKKRTEHKGDASPRRLAAKHWLRGDGEMAERTRALAWSKTPVGAMSRWPQSLKTAVSIMLGCQYPLHILWGPKLIHFYNDAFAPLLGKRHPSALGRPAPLVWSEAWPVIGPQVEAVLRDARSHWNEDLQIATSRNGYPEEVYITFAYGPIMDDAGNVSGVFCACTEETQRVLGRRRLATLRTLAERSHQAKSAEEACVLAAAELARNPNDLPFVALYLLDAEGNVALRAGCGGPESAARAIAERVNIRARDADWPFREVMEASAPVEVDRLLEKLGPMPGHAWPEPVQRALVLPMIQRGQKRLAGFLVAGLSPRLPFDERYRGFLGLIAAQTATAVANAQGYADARKRAQLLDEREHKESVRVANSSADPARSVLLVDDNAETRDDIKRQLTGHYQLETVVDASSALRRAREQKFDVMLADMTLGLDCLALLGALRADKRTREMPIILLAARAGAASTAEALDAGADDYLVKPFSARELLARIQAHIVPLQESRRSTHALSARITELKKTNAEIREARRATLNVLEDVVEARDHAEQLYGELRDRERWLRGQRDALTAAVNGEPLETSLGALIATATEALGEHTRAAFYLADELGTTLHHVVGMPIDYAAAVDGFLIGPESLACGLATYNGEPVLTTDVESDPRWEPWRWLAARYDYRGCWSFPVRLAAKKFGGTFAVYWPTPRAPTPRDLELASLITQTASIIVSRNTEVEIRKQAQQALREREERARETPVKRADV